MPGFLRIGGFGSLTLTALTIIGGFQPSGNGGGAIFNSGTFLADRCTFTGSTGVLVVSLRPRAGCAWETLPTYAAQFVLSNKVKVLNKGKRTANGNPGWLYQYQTSVGSSSEACLKQVSASS